MCFISYSSYKDNQPETCVNDESHNYAEETASNMQSHRYRQMNLL